MIVVIAPYPSPDVVRDGWRSRIAAVDRLFEQQRRTYVEVVDRGSPEPPAARAVSELVSVERLDLALTVHYARLRELVLAADLVYVHTVHFARWVLPFYALGHVVTDCHGLAPEEELMYGKPESGRFYDEVEKVVLRESRWTVAVTQAMVEHLRRKHPSCRTDFVVLPVRGAPGSRPARELEPRSSSERPAVVYSGALQRWQNPQLMLDVVRATVERFDFTFVTGERDSLERMLAERGLASKVRVATAPPEALGDYYRRADYGLVLRDEHVVNRVSCPTKLVEYLDHGVIPVVKSPALGDFERFGYGYVALDDFVAGRLPDAAVQREMRRRNLEAMDALEEQFRCGAEAVRGLRSRLPRPAAPVVALLSDLERNVLYPAFSRLYWEAPGEPQPRVAVLDFAEPYRAVAFDIAAPGAVGRITWTPCDRECQLALTSVRISDEAGGELPYRQWGNHLPAAGGPLVFPARPPVLHFELPPGRHARRFLAEFELLLVGDETRRLGVAAEAPATSGARLRARLRELPLAVWLYRRLPAALRRRLKGSQP